MDLGTAADGMAEVFLGLFQLVSIALHILGFALAIIGLNMSYRAAGFFSLSAIAIVAVNHIWLVYLGTWNDVIRDSAVLLSFAIVTIGSVGAITVHSFRRRLDQK